MIIYRFDPGRSVPVPGPGAGTKAVGLFEAGAGASALVVHVPAGGGLGQRQVEGQELLAVLAGSGWAAPVGGERRELPAGHGALLGPGTGSAAYETGSDEGMTALLVEGDFEVTARVVTKQIVVTSYNPEWPIWFQEVLDYVWPIVQSVALRVDHVGSTSVPGLAAKPIIDMDIVVRDQDSIEMVVQLLTSAGYTWLGDLGVEGRPAFAAPSSAVLPTHNLYAVVQDSRPHQDHWLLRDLLRSDPDARDRYSEVKRRNVTVANGDIDVYLARKARFVADLLKRARQGRGLPPVSYWEPEVSDED